jgi:hypothetical protein
MKIKIIKCTDPSCYWYANKIGETFIVEKHSDALYKLPGYKYCPIFILKKDCEIIEEKSENKTTIKLLSRYDILKYEN